ncbi:hypothetical protein J2810_004783 [Chryseobacterium rhizosphaerae]|uniref:hypothetical protein n=1 Tax=Chryseobacterium rhizosphaerae TaxID=395937 RepID=UPI002859320C|nr:hypothetical protein [Chryseobacterium rhizosphaerae]MDR6548693.1 hypothetical protein [Chryseobacterium rhizosphaerae]
MKRFYCFFGIFLFGLCFSQIKINKRKDIEIFLTDSIVSMERYLDASKPYKYLIINHTSDDYIIDPQGFMGDTEVYECNELYIHPEKIIPKGYYSRDWEDCKEDFIILKKKDSLIVQLAILNIGFFYNLKPDKTYSLDIQSKHNEYTATLLGCKDYIRDLKKQGYKIFEDIISVKIPLKP